MKLDLNYKPIIIYNIDLEIPTKFGTLKKSFKNVNPELKNLFNNYDKLNIFCDLIDCIDIKTFEKDRFYVTFVTSFNSKEGFEDHTLELMIKCEKQMFEEIQDFLGKEISEKYNLRFVKTTNPDYNPISVNNIYDKTDIKTILLRIIK